MNELKENEVEQPKEPLKQQHRYLNSETLTQEDIIQREQDIKKLKEIYTRLPEEWIAMAWNYCKKTPIEEQEKVIKNKAWDTPIPRFSGGEVIAFNIVPKTSEEEKQTEEIQKLKLDLEENDEEDGEENEEPEKYDV